MPSKLRYFPFVIPSICIVIGLLVMAVKGPASGAGGFVMAHTMLLLLAATVMLSQSRGSGRKLGRVESAIREVAQRAFDAPAAVTPKFESSLPGAAGVFGPGGALSPAEGFTAEGTVRGHRAKIASCVSRMARQRFELSHVYSYVTVDAENAAGRFNFVGRDTTATIAMKLGTLVDRKLGDAAFDKEWVVGGDPEIAAAVIEPDLRAQLVALQQRAHGVSRVGMSIELTGEGMVVRWPGELDAELALTLRDVAMRLRDRMLFVLRRDGLIDGPTNVRVDAEARGADASPSDEASAASAAPPLRSREG